jgi:hypothetical protein
VDLVLLNKGLELVSVEHRRRYDEENNCYYCLHADALLTFAQPGSKGTKTTTETITVTGTVIPSAIEDGAAATYQPAKTLVVREDNSNNSGRYVLNGPGHVVNKLGEIIQTGIKPGSRVRVYYANMGDLRMIDHVVVLD